jgi:hypothetical protein
MTTITGRIQPNEKTMHLWRELFPLKTELITCQESGRKIELRSQIARLGDQIRRLEAEVAQ